VKNLSIGANVSYMWGDYERAITNEYNVATINTLRKYYTASVSNYKLDFGAQYTLPIGKKDKLTVGVTFSPAHTLSADPECKVISVNSTTNVTDTTTYTVNNGLELPMMLGAGLQFNHNNQLKLGVDYQQQRWSKVGFPVYTTSNDVASYAINKGAGWLFDYTEGLGSAFHFLGFEGLEAGYMIIFCYCAVAYLIAWTCMKTLVPRYKNVEI
jgi:hypothetical protein